MDIAKLRLYTALATSLHFGRAARLCHVSPSTVSRNLRQLEEELQVRLMERDNRSVSLTPEGESFLVFARESLQQWETFQDSLLASARELRGQLSIYCSVTASYSFLFDILTDFRSRHPGIAIKLHTGDPAQALERVLGGLEDIAIAARPERLPTDISFQRITLSPLIFIAARDQSQWLSGEEVDWRQLPMILSEEGLARDRFNQWCRQQGLQPEIYAEVKGNEAIVSMVSLGFGVGLVPQIVLDNSPLAHRVTALPRQPDLGPFDVGICVLNRRLKSPIIAAFWEQLGRPAPAPASR